jgi:hypothetical protein
MDYVKDVADRNALTKDGELILNTIVERLRVFERPSSKTSGTRLSAIRTFLEWGGLTVTTAPLVPDTCGELYTMFAKDDGPFAALMSVNVGGEEHVATIRKFKDAEGETVLFWLDDLTRPGSDGQPVAWRISFSGELDRKLQWFYNDPPLIALRTLTLVTAPTVVENPLRGEGKSLNHFLTKEGIAPSTYLRDVRKKAKDAGYDPTTVEFATDGEHKVQIHTPDGRTVKFGRVGYGDYLVWSHKEGRGDVPNGTADMKRKVFRISHSAIRGKWRSDRFSPNNLALALLW